MSRWTWRLFAVAFLVVVAGVLAFAVSIYRQHLAIREIQRIGGTIEAERGCPDWIRKRVGDEKMIGFDTVRTVFLSCSKITDDGLRGVGRFARTNVGDAGMERLKGLSRLRILSVSGTRVSEIGVEDLRATLPILHVNR